MKEAIGQQLRQKREAKGLSLEQVSKSTRMRLHYLQALEEGNFGALPSRAQSRGFLRTYANFLNLPAEPLLKSLEAAEAAEEAALNPTSTERPSRPLAGQLRQRLSSARKGAAPNGTEEVGSLPPVIRDSQRDQVLNEAAARVLPEAPAPAASEPPSAPLEEPQFAEAAPDSSAVTGGAEDELLESGAAAYPPPAAEGERASKPRWKFERPRWERKPPKPRPAAAAPALDPAEEAESRSRDIFLEIGLQLQHQRELLGLSIEDVERHTHLRSRYLTALEKGRLDLLPSPVQGRGMLNNYAAFLGMNPEPLLLRFAEGLQTRRAVLQAVQEGPVKPQKARKPVRLPAPLRRFFSGDLLIGAVLSLGLVAFVFWGAIRIYAMRSAAAPSPTAPSIADVLLASPTETSTATPEPVTPTPPPAELPAGFAEVEQTAAAEQTLLAESTAEVTDEAVESEEGEGEEGETVDGAGVQVYITVRQRTWVRVTIDGKLEYQGRLLPGAMHTYSGREQVEITTGNAAGLQIFFLGQDQGVMGGFGEVVSRVFGVSGIVTPTATLTPTPTETPRVSPTPSPTTTPTLPASGPGTQPALP